MTRENVLDAIELVCEAGLKPGGGGQGPNCDEPPSIQDSATMREARRTLLCNAERIEVNASNTVFSDLPTAAIDAIVSSRSGTAVENEGGEYGAQVKSLRAALVRLTQAQRSMATTLREFEHDMARLEAQLRELDITSEMQDLRFASAVFNNVASCGSAVSRATSIGAIDGEGGVAAWTCANSIVQSAISLLLRDLEAEIEGLRESEAYRELQQSFERRMDTLATAETGLREAGEDIDAALSRLEGLRRNASRALGRALLIDSDAYGRQYNVNTVMRRRMNTTRIRYEDARDDALRMSHLARIALEQRLGLELNELDTDLPLVERPATWADSLGTMTGIDYERIRDADDLPSDNYADAYVGDYVTKLEQVIESYRLEYPFQDGRDTAVVSIRDEIAEVRGFCSMPSVNLLARSDSPRPRLTEAVWTASGCVEVSAPDGNGGTVDRIENCMGWSNGAANILSGLPEGLVAPSGGTVTFGSGAAIGSAVDTSTSSFRVGAAMEQTVLVPADQPLILSWYEPVGDPPVSSAVVRAVGPDSEDWNEPVQFVGLAENGWGRFARVVVPVAVSGSPSGETPLTIRIEPSSATFVNQSSELAAIQLERTTEYNFDDGIPLPAPFELTDENAEVLRDECEDTDGLVFRGTWSKRDRYCATGGLVSECPATEIVHADFYERYIDLPIASIESGESFPNAGFARRNYNYRIESMGLNIVGTGVRQCDDDELPSTCYSSGSIPYSIHHLGPYNVRDHWGRDTYSAPLFEGRIEHGRALTAERYITNPISGTDRALMSDYMRSELRGRPLSGRFLIRVWADDSLNWTALEDVQVVLDYRYWTRAGDSPTGDSPGSAGPQGSAGPSGPSE